MVGAEGLGSQAHQAKRPPQGQGRCRAEARGHSAQHVNRWNRVYLVDQKSCRGARIKSSRGSRDRAGKSRPCRDGGGGEIVRFFASVRKGDRDFNIDPPASSYAIKRRAHPFRGENSGPGKDDRGELDTQTRN